MPESYATAGDLAVRWRPLTDAEETRANILLWDASRRVRRLFPRTDDRIAAGELDPEDVAAVVVAAVKRQLIAGGGAEGVTQQNQTAGPFSVQQSFGNPMGDLYFKADEVAVLSDKPRRRAFSVDLTPQP